ncbi:unnamed protein product [Nezara viridula]|uniref:Major facilitator superfamily (MFS) profile domain-containing protein n=1 Tax=Nezara viridula TaxID=85310 RepID=A0A9P0MN31_NEZVI|nr:unnamed protein product [Nezara viridula]
MEETEAVEEDRPSHLRAYVTVLAASLLHMSSGAVTGWSSPILPKLNLTSNEQSLVGSLYSLGAAPGPFIITFGIDTIGRKGTIYVFWACFLLSWIILVASQNLYVIYVARLIGGIGVGGASAGIPVYISEIALPEIRGSLGAMSLLALGFGTLVMFGFGPYITYTSLALYGLAMAAVFGVFFYFVPESPYYYCKKGRRNEAQYAIQKLRGYKTQEKLDEELAQIERAILFEKENASSFLEAIRQPVALKALGIGIFIVAIQQSQGVNPINAYNQMIFEHAQLNFPASYVPVIYLFIGTAFLILPVLMINKCLGVKTAYILSGFGTSISLVLLGVYFYMINSGGVNMHDYSYISVVFLTLLSLFSHLGIAPLTWPIVAEILPLSVKGVCTGICGCISSLIGFLYLAMFPNIAQDYGYSTDFFGFAAILFVSTTIAIFIIPDTTGKTLQEIQELLAE